MAKKSNTNKLPPFVPMTWEMLNSKAYKSLPRSAAKALPYFLGNKETGRMGHRDSRRYEAPFTFKYSEAEHLGFAKRTFQQILSDLVEFGFIDPVTKGGLRGCGFTKSKFKLSLRWKLYGTAEFVEIRKWKDFPQQNPQV